MAQNRDFHDWLLQNSLGIKAPMRRELLRQASLMIADMRSRTDDQTGTLDRSMRVEDGRDDLTVVVKAGGEATTKNGYDYAIGKEFGTRKMPAEPFFWPSYRARRNPMLKAFNDVMIRHFNTGKGRGR